MQGTDKHSFCSWRKNILVRFVLALVNQNVVGHETFCQSRHASDCFGIGLVVSAFQTLSTAATLAVGSHAEAFNRLFLQTICLSMQLWRPILSCHQISARFVQLHCLCASRTWPSMQLYWLSKKNRQSNLNFTEQLRRTSRHGHTRLSNSPSVYAWRTEGLKHAASVWVLARNFKMQCFQFGFNSTFRSDHGSRMAFLEVAWICRWLQL